MSAGCYMFFRMYVQLSSLMLWRTKDSMLDSWLVCLLLSGILHKFFLAKVPNCMILVFEAVKLVWCFRFAKAITFVLRLFFWNTVVHVFTQLKKKVAKITLRSELNFCYSLYGLWSSFWTCPYSYEKSLVQTFALDCHGHSSFSFRNYSPLHICYSFK